MGLGQSLTGVTNTRNAAGMQSNSFFYNVNCVGWGAASSAMIGLNIGSKGNIYAAAYNIQFDGCGSTGLQVSQGPFFLSSGSYFGDNRVVSVLTSGSTSVLFSTGNGFGPIFPAAASAILSTTNGARVFSNNDLIGNGCTFAGSASFYLAGTAPQLNMTNDFESGGCPIGVWADTGNPTVRIVNSVINGSTNSLKTTAGASIIDGGGNTFTGAVANSGNIFGSGSITGTNQTSGNIALTSGWGTANVNTIVAGSDSHKATWTVSITAGVPAASPVITYTFPTAFLVAPFCTLQQEGGSIFRLSNPVITETTTIVTITWTGTPVVADNYIFTMVCQ